eukprot:2230869-Amphidinium_carterae.1
MWGTPQLCGSRVQKDAWTEITGNHDLKETTIAAHGSGAVYLNDDKHNCTQIRPPPTRSLASGSVSLSPGYPLLIVTRYASPPIYLLVPGLHQHYVGNLHVLELPDRRDMNKIHVQFLNKVFDMINQPELRLDLVVGHRSVKTQMTATYDRLHRVRTRQRRSIRAGQ